MSIINNEYNINYYNDGTNWFISTNYNLPLCFNENMYGFAQNCRKLALNLLSLNIDYSYVTNMSWAYFNCYNLTGNPICGDNFSDMYLAYCRCLNLTGSPVCGNKVNNMNGAYGSCRNLTGRPVCGPNVVDMGDAYSACYNLTGSPVCGNNVTSMDRTYLMCDNLTGNPVCGPNVTSMTSTYNRCPNLSGNMFMQSDNVLYTQGMLNYHNSQNTINIYVRNSTTTNSALYSNGVGCGSWTLDTVNNRYYNSANNIYVYYNWDGTIW